MLPFNLTVNWPSVPFVPAPATIFSVNGYTTRVLLYAASALSFCTRFTKRLDWFSVMNGLQSFISWSVSLTALPLPQM